ncbi:hypothetical protein CLU79DRAFT_835034 [Phycomyces nitens]|nr:hypothetical protein CLU79DRAFT_835034 [Phycomyces nitens]
MLQENYKIRASLNTKSADIIEAGICKGKEVVKEYEYESSCKSEYYHPPRTRKYSQTDNMPMLKDLRELGRRSIELPKDTEKYLAKYSGTEPLFHTYFCK